MQGSLEKKIYDTGSFLSEASTWIPEWLRDSAWIEHAPFAFWLVEAHQPEVLIELGTYMGYSFFSFCQAIARLKLSTRAYAVDTWKGDEHNAFYGEEVFQEVNAHNAERYSSFSQLIRSTFDDALPYFEDGSVDLIHIDGRHFYEDVKHDFNSWLPKLSDRGIVLLHDINVRERSFGVFRFWAELTQLYPHFQFFHGWGLGVLGVGKRLPRTLKALFEIEGNSKRANKVRNIYARLGASLQDRSAHRRSASEIRLKEAEASALQTQVSTLEAHVAEATAASEAALSEISDLRSRLSASEVRGTELEAALTLRTSELSELKTEFAEKEEKAARHCGELETALCETRQELDSCKRRFVAAQAALTREHEDAAQHRADLERRLVEAEQSAAQQCLDLQGKLAEAKRSAAQQCADLKSKLAEERQKLQSTVAQLAAARNEHQAALRDIRRDLASKTAQFDAAKAQLDAAEAQFAESTAELARQCDDAARQLVELEAQRVASQERAIAAENRCESLQAEHDGLLNSTFWRATAPARRLGALLPQGVRRQARRGARLLYWVLTPHRIAARIADRRARRETLEKSNTPAWAELFDRNWYLERYPDVAAGADKLDPLRHFIHHGAAEGRDPNPLFDTSWYLESNPDVARAGDNALAHYFEHGAAEGRDPSPLFDTSWYLEANSDVADTGTNPLLHYLRHGAAKGRSGRAAKPPVTSPPGTIARISLVDPQANLELAPTVKEKKAPTWAEFFDPNWYLEHYPDVAKAGINPLNHFKNYGAAEGRDPNPAFDTAWYLSQYSDVAKAGLIAIDHFVEWGAAEGRRPLSAFDYDYYRKQAGIPQASNLEAYRHYLFNGRAAGLHVYAPPTVVDFLRKRFVAIEPLRVYEAPHHGRRVTIVTDSINAGSLYGGVATAIILGVLMARRLNGDLRLVTRTEPADTSNIAMILRTHGVYWNGSVECLYSPPGQGGQDIPVSRNDFFLTTSWWVTRATRSALPASRIFYMIGEDERLFYPTGDDYLLCGETLSDPEIFYAVNSRVLFEHLQANRLAPGGVPFEPAFSSTAYYPEERAANGRWQFFFYGRPNNLRNLYWRGISAIANAIEEEIFEPEQWDFTFLGKDMGEVVLPRGVRPRIMNDASREDYLSLVRRTDVGLSLIYTPHPSYPPFDLAACGAVVVTNRFSSKTDLSRYSPNILCVEPNLPGLVSGLRSAVALAKDRVKCVANVSRFAMPRDWETALGPVLDHIVDRCLGG